jgi:hypothetical protein
MFTPSRPSTRTVLALNVIAAALTCFSLPAWAGEGGAIAAGVAGGVAGTMAGEVLSGALPPKTITPREIRRSRNATTNTARSSAPTPSTSGGAGLRLTSASRAHPA